MKQLFLRTLVFGPQPLKHGWRDHFLRHAAMHGSPLAAAARDIPLFCMDDSTRTTVKWPSGAVWAAADECVVHVSRTSRPHTMVMSKTLIMEKNALTNECRALLSRTNTVRQGALVEFSQCMNLSSEMQAVESSLRHGNV